MCTFFSFVSDGFGNYLYSDWNIRKKYLGENVDSHTWILTHFKIPPKQQDNWHYFEFNPLTKKFINNNDGRKADISEDIIIAAENWAREVDFTSIVPVLIIKSVVHPFSLNSVSVVSEEVKQKLKEWGSVRNSVGYSVRNSVWDSVWNSVWNSVGNSVWNSVGNSVWDSVWNSVGNSVRNSVWNSVGYSVWDSVGVYISSFFDIKYDYDFSSLNYLWNRGFVPSFDGNIWRLHSGKEANVVYQIKEEDWLKGILQN
jgi:hypothetical protein